MAEHDLTQKIIPHLDRHLAIPLLVHLNELEPAFYPVEEIQKAQYEMTKDTNMFDYAEPLYEQVKGMQGVVAPPKPFSELRSAAIAKTAQLEEAAAPVLKVIEDPELVDRLRGAVDRERNMDLLEKEYGLSSAQINALYHYGQFQYSYGDYSGAASYLYHFLILSPSYDLNLSAHWGKLASNILSGNWDAALEEVKDLRDLIDNPHSQATAQSSFQLQARTWLLHWSLFVFFNHPEGRENLLDMFLAPAYLNTVQTAAPYLLRYLVVAAIVCRRSTRPVVPAGTTRTIRDPIKECTRIVVMEEYQYADPITGFLKDLYGDFDFEGAQERLKEAQAVLENDFFAFQFVGEFVENARWLISEVYCRIHRRIDITDLSKRLNLSGEEGEKWIVNLIRDSKLGIDAKIDLKANMLHITRPHPTPTQTLIDSTKGLAFRAQAIQFAINRKVQGEGTEQRGERGERGGRGGRGGARGGRGRDGGAGPREGAREGQGQAVSAEA